MFDVCTKLYVVSSAEQNVGLQRNQIRRVAHNIWPAGYLYHQPCLVSILSGLSDPVFAPLIGPVIQTSDSDWLNLDYSVAPPAILCHKEPAQGTQQPLTRGFWTRFPQLGAFLAFLWFFIAEGWLPCTERIYIRFFVKY